MADAKATRHAVKTINTVKKQLTTIENDLTSLLFKVKEYKDKIKACEFCGLPYIEERVGRSKFCSDICRTNNRNKEEKK